MDNNYEHNVFPADLVAQFVPLDEVDQNEDNEGDVEVNNPDPAVQMIPNQQNDQPLVLDEQNIEDVHIPHLGLVNPDPRIAENQAKLTAYINKHVTRDELQSLFNSRLLVICLPKLELTDEEDDNSFEDRYERFLFDKTDIMFTVTYRTSKFLKKLLTNNTMKEMYDIFVKDIAQKIGSENEHEWLAEIALCYIMYTHMHNRGPRFEFIFELSGISLVIRNILLYFNRVKERVIQYLPRLMTDTLFCVGPCTEECWLRNDMYHFSLRGMRKVDPINNEPDRYEVTGWSFLENEDQLQSHKLKDLLLPPTVMEGESIIDALTRMLNNFNVNDEDTWHTYILLVVKEFARVPYLDNLKTLWEDKLATFGIYVGCTRTGRFRRAHLRLSEDGGNSAVSKYIDATSRIFLVASLPFDNKVDALNAEARLIGFLWYERFMQRRNKRLDYDVLNKNKENIPLSHNTPEQSEEYKRFLESGQRLFRFRGEPVQPNWITEGVLQTYLVDEEIG